MRRSLTVLALTTGLIMALAAPAFACGGLIASLKKGHVEVLQRATTLAAWHNGQEHYVTGFKFAGNSDSFGYLIPLPGNPSKIEKGGDWTLERLLREIQPPALEAFAATSDGAARVTIHQQVKVDALDITVLSGGGPAVVDWANKNGFGLDPDSGEKFGHYSKMGAFFAAAKFDKLRAAREGLVEGEGTTIHFTIATPGPWIPLKILALGKGRTEVVNADLFILTAENPTLSPSPNRMPGMQVIRREQASEQLLTDLRGDKGMEWMPKRMFLTALALEAEASKVTYDLSINGGRPVGAPFPVTPATEPLQGTWMWWLTLTAAAALLVGLLRRIRRPYARTA